MTLLITRPTKKRRSLLGAAAGWLLGLKSGFRNTHAPAKAGSANSCYYCLRHWVRGICRKTEKMKLSLRRVLILFAAMLFALATGMTAAHAVTNFNNAPQGAHYAKGAAEPVCTRSGLTVSCTGTQIAGVGNTNATVSLAVTSTFTGVCHNPGSKDKVVEPFTKSETTTTTAQLTSTKNGRLVVPSQTATGTSTAQFLADFSCPNPNWDAEVTGTSTSFVYTLTFAGFAAPAIRITG